MSQQPEHPGPEIELLEDDPTVPPRPEEEIADAVQADRPRHGGDEPHPHHRKD